VWKVTVRDGGRVRVIAESVRTLWWFDCGGDRETAESADQVEGMTELVLLGRYAEVGLGGVRVALPIISL
jgi:hypothetical protein